VSAVPAEGDCRLGFRRAVSAFPTGVAIVTSEHRGVPAGMTLNSFTSISLEPLLVLVSLAHGSRTLDAVRRSGRYAVSILQRGQRQVAIDFAKRSEAFPELYVRRSDGYLLVRHALAHLCCEAEQLVAAGDHDLAIGRVVAFDGDPGDPLVFHASQFGGVQVDAEAPAGFDLIDDEGVGW
jgi:flavin reductase (DIM6/NTAB) family NADH-FMN oxidoreductase RutF